MCCLGSGLCDRLITRAEEPYCGCVCVCMCYRSTIRFKCESVFQTGTPFLSKDILVVLIDGRLIFISWCFLQDGVRSVVSNNKIISINKIQQDATVCSYLFTASLHVSGVHRAHHQEYKKCNRSLWCRL